MSIYKKSILQLLTIILLLSPQDSGGARKVTPDNYHEHGFKIQISIQTNNDIRFEITTKDVGPSKGDYAEVIVGDPEQRVRYPVPLANISNVTRWVVTYPFEIINNAKFVIQDKYLMFSEFLKTDYLLSLWINTHFEPSGKLKIVLSATPTTDVLLIFGDDCHFGYSIRTKGGKKVVGYPWGCGGFWSSIKIRAQESKIVEFLYPPSTQDPLDSGDYIISYGILGRHNMRFIPWQSIEITIPSAN